MHRVLIVDDEAIIRNGIKQIMPWEDMGIGEAMVAESGEKALELLKENKVDLMLTDICMVQIDGLSLIEKVNALCPEMKIIVMTGYNNFEYAKQCCRMQVDDFLLKPIDENELEKSIRKQMSDLEEKKKQLYEKKMLTRAEGMLEQVKIDSIMKRIINGIIQESDLNILETEYNYHAAQPMQLIIILPILDKSKEWKDHYALLYLSVKNICISIFDSRNQGITFEDELGRIAVAIFSDPKWDETEERVRSLRNVLQDELNMTLNILMGSQVAGFRELQLSYYDALSIIEEYKERRNEVLQPAKAEMRLKVFGETFQELLRTMTENIADEDILLKAYDTYAKATLAYNLSESMLRRTIFQMVTQLYYEYSIELGESPDDRIKHFFQEILTSSREEMITLGREFIINLLSAKKNTHELVRKAKAYIQENLSEELSVTSISEMLYVTTNYFSRLFKKEAEEGCNEYIVRMRMEKAKSLLSTTTIKSGKIAFMVGYKDINYFSLAFKKTTGMSPKEFREKSRPIG